MTGKIKARICFASLMCAFSVLLDTLKKDAEYVACFTGSGIKNTTYEGQIQNRFQLLQKIFL